MLSSNTYRLFKQYGDAILIGNLDGVASKTKLLSRIQNNITGIRHCISEERNIMQKEGIDKDKDKELELLLQIELRIEEVIEKFELILNKANTEDFNQNWSTLSHLLDHDIDSDFQAMLNKALSNKHYTDLEC